MCSKSQTQAWHKWRTGVRGCRKKRKWQPAAPAAHQSLKSHYDLKKKKATTNNRTFSIIYNSHVRSICFWWAARVQWMLFSFCLCFFTSLCIHTCFSALAPLIHWYQNRRDASSSSISEATVCFCPVTSCSVFSPVLWWQESVTCINLSMVTDF